MNVSESVETRTTGHEHDQDLDTRGAVPVVSCVLLAQPGVRGQWFGGK